MRTRLKRYNAGATLNLLTANLLIAEMLPPSPGMHIVKVILEATGDVEFGEYMTSSDAGSRFVHRQFRLAAEKIESLKVELGRLGALGDEIAFDRVDCDFGEYEVYPRRYLRSLLSKTAFLLIPKMKLFCMVPTRPLIYPGVA